MNEENEQSIQVAKQKLKTKCLQNRQTVARMECKSFRRERERKIMINRNYKVFHLFWRKNKRYHLDPGGKPAQTRKTIFYLSEQSGSHSLDPLVWSLQVEEHPLDALAMRLSAWIVFRDHRCDHRWIRRCVLCSYNALGQSIINNYVHSARCWVNTMCPLRTTFQLISWTEPAN